MTSLPCILSVIACAFALWFVLGLGRLDLHVPVTYWGDALYIDVWVKGVMQGNWPWHNSRIGMPFGADWRDFPVNMTVEAIAVRILAIFTSSPGLALNFVWLFGTVACAAFATYGLQRLGVDKWIAGSLGVIYALQPFTFYRNVSHLNLMFYLVPLLGTGAIEIATGLVPRRRTHHHSNAAPPSSGLRLLAVFRAIPTYIYVACVLQGITYIYNAFFSGVLFGVAALLAYAVYRHRASLVVGALALSLICGTTLANLAPSLMYWAKHGKNPAMAYKSPVEAEVHGLKLRHLLTPTPENPLPPLRYIQKKLDNAGFTAEYENATARLGTLGSVGLLFLLASALLSCLQGPSGDDRTAGVLGACSALSLTCFLLATVGGFGSLFNVFVAPDIRGYNRIVVFINFFAIAAIGLLLTRVSAWYFRRNWPKPVFLGALGLLVVFGVSDQAVTATFRENVPRESEFKLDAAFVREVESKLPQNASVFQLPFTDFPADAPPFHMRPYDQGKAYLHSDSLRWSWGGISGRQVGEWARQTSNLPTREMLARLSSAGFSGIWIDRFGYAPGASREREIQEALGSPPLQRSDGRIVLYDLRSYAEQLRASKNPGYIHLSEQFVLHPVEVTFPTGCYSEEQNDKQSWRWCSQQGKMQVYNGLPLPRRIKLAMTLQTGSAQQESIIISAQGHSETIRASSNTVPYVREIQLPAGRSVDVSFDCECKPVPLPPGETRNLYFALINLKITE